jgi:hypothetical protein
MTVSRNNNDIDCDKAAWPSTPMSFQATPTGTGIYTNYRRQSTPKNSPVHNNRNT